MSGVSVSCRFYTTLLDILLLLLLTSSDVLLCVAKEDTAVSSTRTALESLELLPTISQSPSLTSTAVSMSMSTVQPIPTSIPSQHTKSSTAAFTSTAAAVGPVSLMTSTAKSLNLPCRTESWLKSTAERAGRTTPTDPCLAGNHKVVGETQSDYTKYVFTGETSAKLRDEHLLLPTHVLPTHVWLLFKPPHGNCKHILSTASSEPICMQPGYCGSQYPWYVRHSTPLPTKFGDEVNAELCTTDLTSRLSVVCCRKSISVIVRSCGFYYIYKIREEMPSYITGHACTSNRSDSISGSISTLGSLSVMYTADNEQLTPKHFGELSHTERENLVTVNFTLIIPEKIKIRELILVFKTELIRKLNDYSRKKRRVKDSADTSVSAAPLSIRNIRSLIGSPQFHPKNNTIADTTLLYYTFYVQSDTGEITSQSVLRRAVVRIPNTLFTKRYAYINAVEIGIPPNIEYPQAKDETTHTLSTWPPEPAAVSTPPGKREHGWMVIIYIIIFTCSVIIVTLLGLCVYRLKLAKCQHSGGSRRQYKVERRQLCDRSSATDEFSVESKHHTSGVTFLNGRRHNTEDVTLVYGRSCDTASVVLSNGGKCSSSASASESVPPAADADAADYAVCPLVPPDW